jgi:deoxyribose-phosphate aldolase
MKINEYIDHTILKPEASEAQIINLCKEAKEYTFKSVCVNPYYVPLVSQELKKSKVKTCAVIGFPLGATNSEIKSFETHMLVFSGAQEIDMVINIAALKDKRYDVVEEEIWAVTAAAKDKAIVKVIIECCLLTDEEKVKACELSLKAGAGFVKTSTGFSTGGATINDVKLMCSIVGDRAGVKASGGIRDYETAMAMITAGATRIGTSSGVEIMKQAKISKQNLL